MKKFPENDQVTVDYLNQRIFPKNMDCESQKSVFETVGTNHKKVDAWAKVTGSAKYCDDFHLARQLHAVILRSTKRHAKIRAIRIDKALALPGVIDIITGNDFDVMYGIIPWTKDERPLCKEKVRYIGDEVAAVAAISREIAQKAIQLIEVDYDELPVVDSIKTAKKEMSSSIHEKQANNISKEVQLEFGDIETAFKNAEITIEDNYYYEASTHLPLENHAAMAVYSPEGLLTVWSATQTPHYLHNDLAKVLKMDKHRIRVIRPHVGGGFGGKSEPFAHEFCVALLAIRTGRPIKIRFEREETFLTHRGRHAIDMKLKLAYHPDEGLSLDYQAELDGGAYSSYGMVTTYYSGALNAGLYQINNYKWKSTRYFTNNPAAGPKRGHGTVQPRFAIECMMDRLAEKCNEDPIAFRKRLFAGEHVKTINGLEVGSSGFIQCLDQAASATNWQGKFRKLPYGKGIGVAGSMYISGTNYPINPNLLPQSGAFIKADRSGLISIFCGAADIGQGSDTVLLQIAAEELGVNPSRCRIYSGDSDFCPVDLGSYSSRVTLMAGNAVLSAARHLKQAILSAVADAWQVPAIECDIADDIVFHKESEKHSTFIDALHLSESVLGTLASTGSYTTPNRGGTYRGALVGASPAYSFTVQIAEVTVDSNTGKVKVDKITVAHDCGRAINPRLVEGQMEGSVHMGLGEALMEAYQVNRFGLLSTANFLEYKVPTIADTPEIQSIIVEAADKEGPYGAKEAGEGPLLPTAAAIANAIYDAVGIRLRKTPFSPESILNELNKLRMQT